MPINAADFEAVHDDNSKWAEFEAVPDPKALATGVGESLDLTNRVLSTLAAGAIPSAMGQAQGKRIRAEQLQSLAQRAGAMAGGGNVSPSGVPLAAEDMAGVNAALSQGPFSLVPQEEPGPKGGGPLGGVLGMRQEVPGALPSGDIAANIGLPKPPGLYDDTVQGVGESLLGTADFMLSPIGISTLGMGALPRIAQRAVALAFAGQMAHQTPEIARELGTEFGKNPEDRDNQKIAKLITDAATTTGFTALGGLHGLAPGADIPAPGLQRFVDRSVQGPTATGDQLSRPTGAPAPRLEPPPGLDLNSPEEAAAQAEAMNRNATASFGPRGNPQPQVPRLAKPEVPEGPSDPRVTEIQQQGLGTINEILQEYPALKGNRSAARELRNLAFPELKGKPDNASPVRTDQGLPNKEGPETGNGEEDSSGNVEQTPPRGPQPVEPGGEAQAHVQDEAAGDVEHGRLEHVASLSGGEFFDVAQQWSKAAMEGKGAGPQVRAERAAQDNPDLAQWEAEKAKVDADKAELMAKLKKDPSKMGEMQNELMGIGQKGQFINEGIKILKGKAPETRFTGETAPVSISPASDEGAKVDKPFSVTEGDLVSNPPKPKNLHGTDLEQKNPLKLRVAAKAPDGTVIKGKLGDLHFNLKFPEGSEMGFVNEAGEFLSRDEAAAAQAGTHVVTPEFFKASVDPATQPDKENPTKVFMLNGQPHWGTGANYHGDYSSANAYKLTPAADYKGPTTTKDELHKAWDAGTIERGDQTGRVVKFKGMDYVLTDRKNVTNGQARPVPGAREPWQMTLSQFSQEARAKVAEEKDLPPPLPPQYDTLKALSDRNNRKPHNPDLLTDKALEELRADGLISKAPKNTKLTPKGFSQLLDWQRSFRERDLELASLEDQASDKAVDEHKAAVAAAVREGKRVPPQVLEDYPDLAKAATKEPVPATGTPVSATSAPVSETRTPVSATAGKAWGENTNAEEKAALQKIVDVRGTWKRPGAFGPIYPPLEEIGLTKQQFSALKKKGLVEDRGFGPDVTMAGKLEIDPALRESLMSIGRKPTAAPQAPEPKPVDVESHLKAEAPKPEELTRARDWLKTLNEQSSEVRTERDKVEAEAKALRDSISTTRGSYRSFGGKRVARIKASASKGDVVKLRDLERKQTDLSVQLQRIDEQKRPHQIVVDKNVDAELINNPKAPLIRRLDRVVRKLEDAKTPNPQLRQALDDETARVIKERYPDATPEEIKGLSNEVQRQAYFGDDIWGDKGMGQIPSLFDVRKERVRQARRHTPSEELQGKIDRYNEGAPNKRTAEATDELIKAINEDAEAGRAKVAADAKAAQEKEAKAKAEEDKLIEEAQAQADSLPKSGSKGGPTAKAVRDELVRRVSVAMEKLTVDDKTTLEKRADGSYVAQSGEGGGIAFGEIEPTEGGRFVVTARQPGGSKTSHRFTVKTAEEAQTIIKALASSQPGRAIIGVPGDGVFKINRSGEALLRVFKGARALDVNPGGEGLKDRPSDLRPSATSIGPVERALAKLEAEATKARARLKGKEGGTTFGSGPLHELPNIRDYAIIGAAKLARYGLDKARFAAEMVDEFGKRISKHIDRLFEESKVLLARHQEIERNKATPIQQIIGEATGAASAKPSTVGQIIDTLQTGLKTVRALKDHFTDAPQVSRAEVKVADDFLEADANRIRESLGEYVKANLPVAERGRFLTAIGNATRRSPLLTGDPEAMYRRAATVAARIEDRATEVKRNDAVNAIKDNVAKALASPTVDLRFKSAIGDLVKNFTFSRPTEATIAKLRSIREYIASQEALGRDVEMPKAILESLEILNKTPLKDLPVHVLEAMRDRIALLEEMGRRTVATRQLRWENEKAAKNRELANEPTNPLDKRPQFTRGLVEGPDMAQKIGNFIRRQLDNGGLIDKALLPIDALFDLLGDAKGAYKGWLFKNVRNPLDLGFNAAVVMRDRITKPLVDLIKQHNLDDKNARRIGIYAALQQEGGRDRMLAMGATPEELAQLARSLSPAERAAYKVMRTALDQLLPQVQKLMHELYNIPVEPVENYFPMPRDWSKVEVDPEAPAEPKFGEERSFDDLVGWRDMAGDYSPRTTKTEQGMTIERLKGAESAIKIHAFDVFEQNVNDVAHLLSTQRDIKQIGELAKGDLFIEKYGKLGQSMVLNWLDTVARQGKLGGFRRWNMLDVLRKNTSAGVIGFRLASQFVHLSNVPLAMERTGVNNYRSGMVASLTEKGQQFLKDNFAETYARGGGEPALVEATNGGSSVFGKQIVPKRFVKAGFAIAREIDQKNSQATVLGMYFRALKEKGIDPSQYADLPVDKEAQARALVMARRAVASPLPKDVPMALSRGALSGGNLSVGRAMFQFQNIFLDQWSNIRHDLARAGIREALLKNGDPIKAIRTAAALTAMIIAETGIREASKQAIQSATGNKPKHEMPTEGKVAIETLRRFPFMGQATAAVLHNGSGVPLLDSVLDVPRAAYSAITAKGMKGQDRAKIRAISGAAQLMGVPGASQLGEIAEKSL